MKNHVLFNIISDNLEALPIYVESVSDFWPERVIMRENGYPYHQITISLNGSGVFETDGKNIIIKQGEYFFFRKNTPHNYYPLDTDWITAWVAFGGEGAEKILKYLNVPDKCTGSIVDPIVKSLISSICYHAETDNYLKSSILLQELLFIVFGQKQKQFRSQLAVEYIKKNYSKDIQLEDLSALYSFGTTYFCKLFKKEMKVTPVEYLNQYRINMSKSYLMDNCLSIHQIAELCGFRSLEYFCAVFKKSEGYSATEFRKLYGIYKQ